MIDINYINAIPLGKITNWEDKRSSTITPIPFPGQDAGEAEGVDTLGIIAYYNIKGRWTGKFVDIQGYIALIKALLDGNQTSKSTLTSPFVNTQATGSVLTEGTISTNTSTGASQLIDSTATFLSKGVTTSDYVKNLTTGDVTTISSVSSETTLGLASNIFPSTGTPYAVTATMNIKLLSFAVTWEIPGLSICNYQISVMQVK